MKKAILALALVGFTFGAFAQTAPVKAKAHSTAAPAKADTAKHAKAVKKTAKKAEAKKM